MTRDPDEGPRERPRLKAGRLWPVLVLMAGCGEEPSSSPRPGPPISQAPVAEARTPPAEAPGNASQGHIPAVTPVPPPDGGESAAQALRSYYALIESGRYREAWRLRSGGRGGGEEAFVQSFGQYAQYRATVGTPSEVVESNGWLYVEVPVQTYGRMKDGQGFGSAGIVTLRRRMQGSAEQRRWRIAG